jgi:lipopolysaccharide biosynthesis glycosyltransferase
LSKDSIEKIKSIKKDAKIIDPGWKRTFKGYENQPSYKKVFFAKPYLPEIFPGYDGYFWVDADIWFLDSSALFDFERAAEKTGLSVVFECHPFYKSTMKVRCGKLFNFYFIKGIKSHFLNKTKDMFGTKTASDIGIQNVLNSGIFFAHKTSKCWSAWEKSINDANIKKQINKGQFCDQTCLFVSLFKNKIPFSVMPATHNFIAKLARPLYNQNQRTLVDPVYPHPPIKVLHMMGDSYKKQYNIQTIDGKNLKTCLRRSSMIDLL